MKTIKLELSVKLLLGAKALGLFLNAFNDSPPKANALGHIQKIAICDKINPFACLHITDNGRILVHTVN